MSDRFEILSDTHKVQVADYDKEQKYVFNQAGSDQPEITTLSKIVHSTDKMAITPNEYNKVAIQDVPSEVYDFLESEGYDVTSARSGVQF